MRRSLALVLTIASACSGKAPPPPSGPSGTIEFRVVREASNTTFCVEGPAFAVARDESGWLDVFDRQTECQVDAEIRLPDVRFDDEVGVAAWWRTVPCAGYTIRTESVGRDGGEVVVTARSSPPPSGAACAGALAGLESFLALRRSALYDGSAPIRFVLDGVEAGRAGPG